MIPADLKRPLLFIVAVHLVYAILAMLFKQALLVDSYGYLMQADNLKQYGSWYAENWNAPVLVDYFSIRPPLYAALLAICSYLPLGWIWILVTQNLLSIFNCVLVYKLAQEWGVDSKRLKILGACALILYPAQCIHANFVMTEIVFQSLLLGLFVLAYRFNQQPTLKRSLMMMVVLSLSLLTKPVSLFLPLLAVVLMVWSIYKHKQSITLLLPILGVALVFHLICLQNKYTTGFYHYTSIKYINQLKYNARFALADTKGETVADSVVAVVVQQANGYTNYQQRLECFDSAATAIIKQYPVSFAKVYAKGVIAFFVDPGRFEVYQFLGKQNPGQHPGLLHEVQAGGGSKLGTFVKHIPLPLLLLLLSNLCWNLFVVGAFVFFVLDLFARKSGSVLLVVMILYIAMTTGPVGVSRYRVPVEPLLILAMLTVNTTPVFLNRKKHNA